ncbi:hypothetical protein DM806_05350 [Sphingobium lactosutens]|uniref:hypothetical protein n=1 Tax=Sphingobium lactosutens TaxID=522773 RepID=UPI0015B80B25|nr:hypothetical protein [Sphingobium lactosutens]NWK95101.1 hypothetical protein [Sphingobium lactosutens]
MKAMRYALTALLCYAAFWGAAHVGMLPVLRADAMPAASAQAMPGVDASRQMWRYLPIIR